MYKVYRKTNYIVVEDILNKSIYNGLAKEVFVDKSNKNKSEYRIYNVKDLSEEIVFKIGNIQKQDGSDYSLSEWETFYEENTGFSTALGGSSAYTFPNNDGTDGQVLTTDGSGNVTFEDAPAEYTNTDNTNGRLRKYIIPSDFDFENIPTNYNDAIWEIRHVHDLGAANISLPNNVTLFFNGGRLTNYGTITLDETKFTFSSDYACFDASGDFSGAPKIPQGFITPIHFGAVPDDTTDCTDAFNKMIAFIGSQRVNFIDQGRPAFNIPLEVQDVKAVVPSGTYKVTNSIIFRAGLRMEGSRNSTIIHFEPTVLGTDLFVIDGDINSDYNYDFHVMQNVRVKGFTLTGDVNYDGSGNAGNAIYTNNASQLKFEDIYISKFERGVSVNIGTVPRAAYYNKFKNVHIQFVKQAVYVGVGTAVTDFEDCIFVARAEFLAKYTHLIEVYNNTTFRNCSFEGGTPVDECIYAPIGKVTILGGRDESNSLLKFNGRGVTGGVTVILPNGPTGLSPTRYGTITDIDDAPVQADMSDDQNVLTQNINFGQGVAQELKMLKNQSWKLGTLDWTFDGTDGFYELVNDRADLFGAENGIKIQKTDTTSSYAITQPLNINTAKFYATVWVKKSEDADLRAQIGFLYASDNTTTPYFKEFIPILQTEGGWTLYAASVAHYYKNVPTNNPRPYLGLTTASPTGSWAIFSNLRFWAGGFPLFSGSDDNQVNKEYIVSALPTQGLLESGDIVTYDGTNASYPLDANSSKGVICSFNLDTTLDGAAVNTDTTIDIPDASDVEADDYIGIYKNTGGIHWTTVASISTNTITLSDALDGDADSGNKVYIYRLIPKESSGGTSSGGAITAVKKSDETVNSNNTVALDSELQIALEASSYYQIEVQLNYEADGTPDFRVQLEVPTGAEGEFWRINNSSTTGVNPLTNLFSCPGLGIGSASHVRMFVTIYTGVNSGTFGVKWAQNTSDAADTTLKKGSSIKAVKLN